MRENAPVQNPVLDVSVLGQVFTPNSIVCKMLALRQRQGTILEPACGDGAFLSSLEEDHAVGIEIDQRFTHDERIINCDFFTYPRQYKFDTIIGNPPYVRYRDIAHSTKALLQNSRAENYRQGAIFDRRTNLYLFFIDKCLDHLTMGGELIMITPRDFLKATSARHLNRRLYEEGSMTHFYDLGDAKIFDGATPNCAIWRWVKGRRDRTTETGGNFNYKNGLLWFGDDCDTIMDSYFDIKVGAVSGADKIFSHDRGCTDFVCSQTVSDKDITRRMIYNRKDTALDPHKEILIKRKIRKFDESNWWEWGRKYHEREGERIYVNCKTRHSTPFFVSEVKAYDGSVLALFPKKNMNLGKVADSLNKIDWQALGFMCDGRLLFTQRSLANTPIEAAL